MEPDIKDGSLIFVDKSKKDINKKGIFVVSAKDEIYIKIIKQEQSNILLQSINEEFNNIRFNIDEIDIIGKVCGIIKKYRNFTMSKSRDDFTEPVKRELQRRVGTLCSNPECKTLTSGPNENKDKSTSIGVAAHITAAAPNGPRYDEKLNSSQRSDISNGIWLCLNCSTIIDKDSKRFNINLLKEWKKKAEDFARDVIDGKATHTPPIVLKIFEDTISQQNEKIENRDQIIKELEEKYLSVTKSLEMNSQGSELERQSEEELKKGNFKEAQNLLLEDIKKKDKQNAQSYFNVAEIAMLQINYDEALTYYKKAATYDESNAKYLNQIAAVLHKIGEDDESIIYSNKALEICLSDIKNHSMDAVKSYNRLAAAYKSKFEYDTALIYSNEALQISINEFGENSLEVVESYTSIGGAYNFKGEYDTALINSNKALKILLDKFQENHDEISKCYNNIAGSYHLNKDWDNAIKYYKKSLEQSIYNGKEYEPNDAVVYNNIAGAYNKKGNTGEAIIYSDKSLKILTEKFGSEHHFLANSYLNMAETLYLSGEFDISLQCSNRALEILIKKFGENDYSLVGHYINIGIVYNVKSEYSLSILYFEKALKITINQFGENHSSAEIVKQNIQMSKNENKILQKK